jgi:ABC-type branched-subunit amino acid transport system ATPase component
MAQGRLIALGDAAAVRADPRVVEAYLGGAIA